MSLDFAIDMTGQQIGEWTVLYAIPSKNDGSNTRARFRCRCSCGHQQDIYGYRLRRVLRGRIPNAPRMCRACTNRQKSSRAYQAALNNAKLAAAIEAEVAADGWEKTYGC